MIPIFNSLDDDLDDDEFPQEVKLTAARITQIQTEMTLTNFFIVKLFFLFLNV